MSYEVNYNEIARHEGLTESAKRRLAIIDLIRYVELKRAKILFRAAREPNTTYEQFAFYCGFFCGVQGFPVRAAWDYFHSEDA